MNQIQRRVLGLGVLCVSLATSFALLQPIPITADLSWPLWSIAVTIALVTSAWSLLLLLTSWDTRPGKALVRLDWFTPMIRRVKQNDHISSSWMGGQIRRLLPQTLQSDWKTKKRGPLRRGLRKLGISWVASPVRRLVQSVCLLTFLSLFFYVCWPYDARPQPPGAVSSSWRFESIEPESGHVQFTRLPTTDWAPSVDQSIYVTDDDIGEVNTETAAGFRVTEVRDGVISLQPAEELSASLFDRLVTGNSLWTLSESDPTAWPSHYTDNLAAKEILPAEIFLVIDPLVSLSTAIASRSWIGSLASAGVILIVCVLIPRGFCGYLCPLGTTIDLFDWAVGRRVTRFRIEGDGWWVHIKYYLLAGTLVAAVFGVLLSGLVSAIPVLTRGLLFLFEPLQNGVGRGWHLVPAVGVGQILSVLFFFAVLGLGFFRPRFWCKYVCPSGAVFSISNLFRATERKVESSCINCNKCVEICPFDAIKPDFTTRTTDCTLCQSCAGVCPTHAIKFVERWNVVELKIEDDPPTNETALGRRGFLSLAGGTAAAVAGGIGAAATTKALGANLDDPDAFLPVRPPGSVPEREFLQMCIRCGECFKACPNNVLQPEGFQQGLEGLWSPMVNADWAGCESSCNACGQVCPTGAIRALPLEEKREARMGLAIVDQNTCLPFAGAEECDLCVQECHAAGYHAIEFEQVGIQLDEQGIPVEGTGYSAPVVLQDLCVGCGLCQTRCHAINVKERGLLNESAIIVRAGGDREDRMMSGSYLQARKERMTEAGLASEESPATYFVPEDDSDPFGTESTDDSPF